MMETLIALLSNDRFWLIVGGLFTALFSARQTMGKRQNAERADHAVKAVIAVARAISDAARETSETRDHAVYIANKIHAATKELPEGDVIDGIVAANKLSVKPGKERK